MEFIQSDNITSTSVSTGALSGYGVANIEDDHPGKPFISSGTSETITVAYSTGAKAVFLFGLMADVGVLTIADDVAIGTSTELNVDPYSSIDFLKLGTTNLLPPEYLKASIGGFSGTVLSSPLTTDTTCTDTITGAPNTLELQANITIGDGQSNNQELVIGLDTDATVQFNGSGTVLNAGSATIQLTSSTDRKDSAVSGDDIGYWTQDSGATGRFSKDATEASSSNFVNVNNHGGVLLGSHVKIGGTSYQITKIVGDGTSSGAITLSSSVSTGAVTQILNPIKLGIFKVGSVLNIANPQFGMQKSFADFSYKRPLIDGGYVQTPRNVTQIYVVSLILARSEAESLVKHFRAYRSKPFPILVLDSMPSGQSEKTKYSGFCFMPEPPKIRYSASEAEYQNLNFRLQEIT